MKYITHLLGTGQALALGAMIFFSASVVLTKWSLANSSLDFYSMAIWGWFSAMLLASLTFYLPVKAQRERLLPQLKQHRTLFGSIIVLNIINGSCWFYGLSQISGGVVALIDQNVLVWSFILGALFLKERFSWRQLCAIGITLIGLAIISSLKGEVTVLGVVCLLTCGLSIATQSVLMKLYPKPFDALALTFWRGWGLSIFSLFVALGLGVFNWHIEWTVFWVLLAGQYIGLFAGRAMYIKAHEYMAMSHLSFLMLGIPVLVLTASYLFLDEPISLQKIIGATIMLIGLTWFISRKAKRES